MDGTTEPIIVVIGHPIAGNPAQFAAERALRSLKLDWRVLSFDVLPGDVAAALEGFAVTGVKGVFIDSSLSSEAKQWYSQRTDATDSDAIGSIVDCLFRDSAFQLLGEYEQRRWVDEQISRHGGQRLIWIGQRDSTTPASGEGFQEHATTPNDMAELAGNADVIVINDTDVPPVDLDADEWPTNDGSTLVIDLTNAHPEIPHIKHLGYRILSETERRIGTLQRCLHSWTGQYPSAEVLHDAIEEYLSV